MDARLVHGTGPIARLALVLALAIASDGLAQSPQPAPEPTPIMVLRPGEDLEALLKRLGSPDLILRSGNPTPTTPPPTEVAPTAGVSRLDLKGQLADDGRAARLEVDLDLSVSGKTGTWVPIGFDGQILRSARDGDRELDWRSVDGRWQIRVPGPGQWSVRVELLVPLRIFQDRRTLDLVIPEAPSTRVALDLPYPVEEALGGDSERLLVASIDEGRRSRVEADLPARSRLQISWIPRPTSGDLITPLVSARGQIALDVGPGGLLAHSSWVVRSRRGELRTLTLELDPGTSLVDLEREGLPLAAAPSDAAPGEPQRIQIPLSEPIRAGQSQRFDVTTQQSWASDRTGRASFRGHRFREAGEQTGYVTVAVEEQSRLVAFPGRWVRQIDPRDLSENAIQARPSIVSAYAFSGQPFDLELWWQVDEPRPLATSKASLALSADRADLRMRLDYQLSGPSTFQLELAVPSGLEVIDVGPRDQIASWQWLPSTSGSASTPEGSGTDRIMRLTLSRRARESGRCAVELVGRSTLDAGQRVGVPLPRPVDTRFLGGLISLLATPSLQVEAGEQPGLRAIASAPPEAQSADWPWPIDRAGFESTPSAWLRYPDLVDAIDLRVTRRPMEVRVESSSSFLVGRDRIEARQQLDYSVRHGRLSQVDLVVPRAIESRWEVDRSAVERRERIGPAEGGNLYRLTLARPVSDEPVGLTIRYRLPVPPDRRGQSRAVELELVRPVQVSDLAPPRVSVAAESGVELSPVGEGWERARPERLPADSPKAATESTNAEWVWTSTGASAALPRIDVATPELASLPGVIASRAWLRSTVGPGGDVEATAWYRLERHSRSLDFKLPPLAELVRVVVDGQPAIAVERAADAGHYRVRFRESTPISGVVVGVEYRAPASAGVDRWRAPALSDGGIVQQALWEVQVPWNQMVLGVPAGWADENQWYWGGLVWQRRPWRDATSLASWLGAGGSASLESLLGPSAVDDGRLGYHAYLFGRPGDPVPLNPAVISRALVVGLASGAVLALGLSALIVRRLSQGIGIGLLALALVSPAFVDPSTIAQLAQSSLLGLGLVGLAALTQWIVERRRRPSGPYSDVLTRPGGAAAAGSGSIVRGSMTGSSTPLVGSDDSTAIRPRSGSASGAAEPAAAPAPIPASTTSARTPRLDASTPITLPPEVIDIPAPREG